MAEIPLQCDMRDWESQEPCEAGKDWFLKQCRPQPTATVPFGSEVVAMSSNAGGCLNQPQPIRKCFPDVRGTGHKEEFRVRTGVIGAKMVVKREESCCHTHILSLSRAPGWVQKSNSELSQK